MIHKAIARVGVGILLAISFLACEEAMPPSMVTGDNNRGPGGSSGTNNSSNSSDDATLTGEFVQISAGFQQICGVQDDGRVDCIGPVLSATSRRSLIPPRNLVAKHVVTGGMHACALLAENDNVRCWGELDKAVEAPDGEFVALSANIMHTCGLRPDKTAVCWGDLLSMNGQQEEPEGEFLQISAGHSHACGLLLDGTVQCWGSDLDSTDSLYSGQSSPPEGSFKQVSAGGWHTCAIRTDDTVQCWGSNSSSGLPEGDSFTHISAGRLHTCGLRDDKTVICWGLSQWDHRNFGQAEAPDGEFKQISSGSFHTCGIRPNNTVECWGDTSLTQQ